MRWIEADNAGEYLAGQGWLDPDEPVQIRALSGGVSNVVLYVAREPGRPDFVLKQARPQLRVEAEWLCPVERIWREIDVLETCARLFKSPPAGIHREPLPAATPAVLHVDRENFAFAMTAAPLDHRVWRDDLLAGTIIAETGWTAGRWLGRLHAASWHDPRIAAELDDRQYFRELRLDPYYAHVARAFPDFSADLTRLIDSVWNTRQCLVHADFSPKNILLHAQGLLLVDFETGHFGDPAFDLGFFLSHLVLKAFHRPADANAYLHLVERFWEGYQLEVVGRLGGEVYTALVGRAVQNFAGCAWARLDGKSPVHYVTDSLRRGQLRQLCQDTLRQGASTWPPLAERCLQLLRA